MQWALLIGGTHAQTIEINEENLSALYKIHILVGSIVRGLDTQENGRSVSLSRQYNNNPPRVNYLWDVKLIMEYM